MRIAVVGAGAVGCYSGALLARAGYDVTLITRPAQAALIQARGILLEEGGKKHTIRLKAVSDSQCLPVADLVLVSVKVGDNAAAAPLVLSLLGKDTVILSMQNGVDTAAQLSELTGREVLPSALYIAVDRVEPGHVVHRGGHHIMLGSGKGSRLAAAALNRAAPLKAEISQDIPSVLWEKLTVNCVYNALSAITLMPYAAFGETDGAGAVIQMVLEECRVVAQACGVILPADMTQRLDQIIQHMPTQKSSAAQDVIKGRATEIEFINGYVVRKAGEYGIAVPVNFTLLVIIRMIEKRLAQEKLV